MSESAIDRAAEDDDYPLGYRERPIEEDFYRCPKGDWVYKWRDERLALRSDADRAVLDAAAAETAAYDACQGLDDEAERDRRLDAYYEAAAATRLAVRARREAQQ